MAWWGILLLSTVCLGQGLFYYRLLFGFADAWPYGYILRKKLREQSLGRVEGYEPPKFSILIPVRNEEGVIANCLTDLLTQNYPNDSFEVIVIDDFSEDATAHIVESLRQKFSNLQLISLAKILSSGLNAYKKLGLTEGIKQSSFEWIITTDADCRRGPDYLRSISDVFELRAWEDKDWEEEYLEAKKNGAFWADELGTPLANTDIMLLSAPVRIARDETFFQRWQAMEFAGLVAIGGASIFSGKPTMCNGANLIYRKEAFHAVSGYEGLTHLASGDDELLMHRIHAKFPEGVHFLDDERAIVSTQPAKTVKEFIRQRKRWVSKSTHYKDKRITLTLMLAWLFNLSFWINFVLAFWEPWLWISVFLAAAAKLIGEWYFFDSILPFFREEKLLRILIPASILQSLYVLFIGIYGNFGGYRWKGRKVR